MDFKKFKNLRTEKLLSQEKAAEMLEISDKAIRNWESGNFSPSRLIRDRIVNVFFIGDCCSFFDYFAENTESALDKTDFSAEEQLINSSLENGTLLPIFASPLRQLFNVKNGESVGVSLCSILGALRGYNSGEAMSFILGELASILCAAKDIQINAETGMLVKDLIFRLKRINAINNLPEIEHREIRDTILDLQNLTPKHNSQDYLNAFRRSFSVLCNNSKILCSDSNYAYSISDIFIPLSTVSYSASDRRHLFYALFQCAKNLSVPAKEVKK